MNEFKEAQRRTLMVGRWGLLLLLLTPIAMLAFLAAINPGQIIDRYAARNELMTGTLLASAVIGVCVVVEGGILALGLRWLARRHVESARPHRGQVARTAARDCPRRRL